MVKMKKLIMALIITLSITTLAESLPTKFVETIPSLLRLEKYQETRDQLVPHFEKIAPYVEIDYLEGMVTIDKELWLSLSKMQKEIYITSFIDNMFTTTGSYDISIIVDWVLVYYVYNEVVQKERLF
jgi:hypothetical protein